MEKAVEFIFAVVAVGILIAAVIPTIKDYNSSHKNIKNEKALSTLSDRINFVCGLNLEGGYEAIIDVASGTIFYAKKRRVCYDYEDTIKCLPVECELKPKYLLNLTSEIAMKTYESNKFHCHIQRNGTVVVKCD